MATEFTDGFNQTNEVKRHMVERAEKQLQKAMDDNDMEGVITFSAKVQQVRAYTPEEVYIAYKGQVDDLLRSSRGYAPKDVDALAGFLASVTELNQELKNVRREVFSPKI